MKKFLAGLAIGLSLVASTAYAVSVFSPKQGGTGIGSTVVGDIGKCLSLSTWSSPTEWTYAFAACASGGGGTDGNWVYFNGSGIRPATTSNQILGGRTSTTTNSIAEFNGTTTATNFVATSTTATSTFPVLYSATGTVSNLNGVIYVGEGQFAKTITGINNALSAASGETYCSVKLSTGVFSGAGNVNVPSNCILSGEGTSTIIKLNSGASVSVSSKTNSTIRNLLIDASSQVANNRALSVANSTNVTIDNITIPNAVGFGIFIDANGTGVTDTVIVKNSTVTGLGNNDVIGGGPSSVTDSVRNVTITGNTVIQNYNSTLYENAIDLVAANGLSVSNNTIYGRLVAGSEQFSHHNVLFSMNTLYPANGTSTGGISILLGINATTTSKNISIIGNNILIGDIEIGGSALSLVTNSTIAGNTILGSTWQDCISMSYGENISVTGNTMENCNRGVLVSNINSSVFNANSIGTSTYGFATAGITSNISFGMNPQTNITNPSTYLFALATTTIPYFSLDASGNMSLMGGAKFSVAKQSYPSNFNVYAYPNNGYGSFRLIGGNGAILFQGGGLGDNTNYIESMDQGFNENRTLKFTGVSNRQGSLLLSDFATSSFTGSVGIGTTTPSAILTVQGTYGSTTDLFDVGTTTASIGTISSIFKISADRSITIGSGTTTSGNGFNITSGCFSVAGTCLSMGGSGASSTLLVDNNRFTGGNIFTSSTTIGSLTISGNSTTTGSSIVGTTSVSSLGATMFVAGQGTGSGNTIFHVVNSNNSEIVRVRGDSRVGIVGNPGSTLGVGGNVSIGSTFVGIGGGTNALTVEGNAGVGSSTPFAKLSVKGTGATTAFTFQTTNSSNVPTFNIQDNGNLGIGTTSPYSMLSVAGQVVGQNFVATSTTAVSSFQQLLANASTTLQNFTGLNSTTTNATTTTLAAGTICLTADTCRTTWPTSGGGSSVANATNTIDWIIYPYGSNVAVWRAKTQSAVTTFTDFDDAANYVVNLATSSVPAENSIKIGTGVYQVNATTTMDGNGVGFSAVKFFWYGNGTSTMLVVNNNTSAFFMTDRARVHFEDIGFNLNGGADAFYASTTQASPVSSLNESEFFGIKAYSSGVNHTGWVFHFKDAFRYHIMDFHAKDVGNCFSDENNYSNNAFINGDGQIDGFNFCELNNPTAGVNNGGRVVSLYGRQGLVNQMVFKNINGITNSNNSTMFYINHASRVVIEDNNSEQFATTTDIINSNGVNMKTTKYMTPWNALANATLISTDANSYNNTFSLSEVELSAATYIFKDSNTIAPTRPNILQGYNGGQFVFGDNGGSALWATTTSTVVRDVFDNIGAGTNSYLGRVKITGGNIAMDFLNSRTTLFQYSNSAYRWLDSGTERMNLSSTGALTLASAGISVAGSSTLQNFTALRSTTTAATTTDFTVTDAPIFSALSGLLKGNGSSPLTAAVDGTDFTLIDAMTCGAGQHLSAVTAAGVFTCSADSGGGGGGSGIGWAWNNINSLYMSTSTDDLLLGASATSSTAKFEVIDNGLLAWFASTTGATIRPIFTAFRNTTTGVSGIGVNASTTEDSFTVNGRSNLDPMLAGCDLIGIGGNVTTDQLAGQLCDWLAFDINTDGRITQAAVDDGADEAGMPIFTRMEAGITTSIATNELAMFKTQRAISATTTLVAEQYIRLPSTNTGTSTRAYIFGLGGEAQGSLTTSAAYLTPTNACHFVASSTANFQAVTIRAGTQTITDTGIATSTVLSTFSRFRVQQDYVNGCQYMVNGTVMVTHAAANAPTTPMVAHWGVLSTTITGGAGTAGIARYDFAEPKVWWGRWQPK